MKQVAHIESSEQIMQTVNHEHVMTRFQETMSMFLDTQKLVMQSYLQSGRLTHSGQFTIPPQKLVEEPHYGVKEKNGFSEVSGLQRSQMPIKEDSTPVSFPLTQGATLEKGPNGSFKLIQEVNPSQDIYLKDHQFGGKYVFPMAMGLELMTETVALGWPDLKISTIKNMDVLKGIFIENDPKPLLVIATPKDTSQTDETEIDVVITGMENHRLAHYRATFGLMNYLPEPPRQEPVSIDGKNLFNMTVEDAYRRLLFHGPYFQNIVRIQGIDKNGIRGSLKTSSPQEGLANVNQGQWIIDPIIIDSSLQLLLIWGRLNWDMTGLPTRFTKYRYFGPLTGSMIDCQIRLLPDTHIPFAHADIAFYDTDGRLRGIIEGMEGMFSKQLNRLAGSHLKC